MAGYRGQDISYLWVGTSAPTASGLLENTKGDIAIAITNPEIDTSDDASGGDYEFILGNGTRTISGSFNYLKAADATNQQILIDAAYDKTLIYLEWAYETTATTGKQYEATGYVTDISSVNGDPQTMSFTIKINGAVTEGTQPA